MLGPVSTWEDHGVETSGTLPNDWYTSRELFELEQRTFFREVWHCVGPLDQVAQPGLYFVLPRWQTRRSSSYGPATVSSAPCRTSACTAPARWRSAPASAERVPVPVPRLDVRLDGRLRKAQGMEDRDFATDRPPSARSSGVGSLGAECLGDARGQARRHSGWLEDVTPRLATTGSTDELRFAGGRRWEIGCNWKLYVDNYMEGYHIPFIHPGLAQSLSPSVYTYRLGRVLERAVRRRAAPARPGSRVAGILGGTQEFRALKPPLPGLDETERDGLLLPLGLPADDDQLHAGRHPHVHVRPLEPERPSRSSCGGSPRRGRSRTGCCRPRSSTSATSSTPRTTRSASTRSGGCARRSTTRAGTPPSRRCACTTSTGC